MAELLGDRRELVDEVLDVLERLLRSERPRLMALTVTGGIWHGAVIGY
jgi:hypothetical protein